MVSNAVFQLILSFLFGATGLYFLARLFVGLGWIDRLINFAHVVMSSVMFAMVWPWGTGIPVVPQILFFSVAALWFVFLALFRPNAKIGPVRGHHQSPVLLGYHAIMMSSMVWMAAMMLLSSMPMRPSREMRTMSSMKMGMTGSSPAAVGSMILPSWANIVSIIFAAFFAAAAVVFIVQLIRQQRTAAESHSALTLPDNVAAIMMAVGMALAFIAMR